MIKTVISPVIAIIQARMGSTRLPGKVLLDLSGQPMLTRVIERTRKALSIDGVVVATTTDPSDEPIVELCRQNGFVVFRGNEFDVLDRYYQTACEFEAQTIVRITADCPLIDPEVIDRTVSAFFGQTTSYDRLLSGENPQSADLEPDLKIRADRPCDFAANRLPPPFGRTFPIGLDTEVCSFEALETAWLEAEEKHQREHVMPFFYDNLDRFRVLLVNHEKDFGDLRWTVDTPKDLQLLRQIFNFFPGRFDFSWSEVLELFEQHPELAQINAQVKAKNYRQVDERQK
jgi:spore coat polysaccharide biosynthesis protein SpsF